MPHDEAFARAPKPTYISFFHRLISLIFMSGTFAHNRSGPAEWRARACNSLRTFAMDGKRKLDTDAVVATAMQEEEGRKKQKKGTAAAQQGNR